MTSYHFSRLPVYLLPAVIAFVVIFRPGLDSWFQQDDFAHLQLAAATSLADLPAMMMTPIAQGTFRPLSERLFYWVIFHFFGLDAFPARIFCFLLQTANCLLLGVLIFRFTRSRWAAALGAAAWAVQPCLAMPMTWVATTNQVMLACCVLATMVLFERYGATGNRWMLTAAWVCYLIGFGVLESNIATAALVSLYVLLMARRHWKAALAMWAPAIAFTVGHLLLIPRLTSGTYGMRWDWGIASTAWTYWQRAGGGGRGAVSVVLIGLSVYLAAKKSSRPLALLGLGWFLAALAPMLPLQGHLTDYYLTIPSIGISFLFAAGWQAYPRTAMAVLGCYFLQHIPVAYRNSRVNVDRSLDMQALVLGVEQAQRLHPDSTLLLDGIGDGLFWSGVYDNPFRLVRAASTKLTPEAAARLTPYLELFRADDYTLPEETVSALLATGRAEVYTVANRRLIRSTATYIAKARQSAPRQVDLASTTSASFLGPEWHVQEDGFRWMPGRATATLEGAGKVLEVKGFCVPGQAGVTVSGKWGEQVLAERRVEQCPGDFALSFPLPAGRTAKARVTLTATPPIHIASDERELALAVQSIAIR